MKCGLQSLRIDGAHHEVAVRPQGEGVYWVSTAQGAGAVEVLDPLAHLAAQSLGGKAGKRRQRVDAYMPGRVTSVLESQRRVLTDLGCEVEEAGPNFDEADWAFATSAASGEGIYNRMGMTT